MSRERINWPLLILLALFVVRVGLYIALIPPDGMPDERGHFIQIRMAQEWGKLYGDRPYTRQFTQEIEADYLLMRHRLDHRPDPRTLRGWLPNPRRGTAYYRLMGGLAGLLGLEDNRTIWYFGRVMSLLAGLAVIGLTYAAGRALLPERPLVALAAAGFLALLPQYGALSAVMTTDKPAELIGAAFFLTLILIARRATWPRWLAIGVILALLPVIKKTAFFLVLAAALAALPGLIGWLKRHPRARPFAWAGGAGLLALAAGIIWWPPLAAPAAKLLGLPVLRLWIDGTEPDILHQAGMIDIMTRAIRPLDPVFWQHLYLNLVSLFKSSWAMYGYLDLPLPLGWYLAAGLLCLTAGLGWLRLMAGQAGGFDLERYQVWAMILLAWGALLVVAVVVIRQVAFFPGSLIQGRYAFTGLTPLALLGAVGYLALWPPKWRGAALAAAAVFLAAMDLAGLWRVVVPYHYYVVM